MFKGLCSASGAMNGGGFQGKFASNQSLTSIVKMRISLLIFQVGGDSAVLASLELPQLCAPATQAKTHLPSLTEKDTRSTQEAAAQLIGCSNQTESNLL